MRVNIINHPTHAGAYYVEYRPEGARGPRVREPFASYVKAEARKRELEGSARSKAPSVVHPRIDQVYEEYLKWVELNQSSFTLYAKKRAFKATIIPYFGRYRVKELTQSVFDGFHQSLAGKRAATTTYQMFLLALVKWMQERDMAPPLGFTPKRPKYHAPKPIIPSMKDIQAIIDHVRHPGKRALLITMLWTGLRWNEARLLRWEDVFLTRGIIRVRESDTEEEVHIPIYPEMHPYLEANKKTKGWVFPSNKKNNGPWTAIRSLLTDASEVLGVDISPHDFRRRSGQNVYEASGFDIFAAQRHLRHKDIKTTMRYLGISDQRQAQIMDNVIAHVAKLRNVEYMDNSPKKQAVKRHQERVKKIRR